MTADGTDGKERVLPVFQGSDPADRICYLGNQPFLYVFIIENIVKHSVFEGNGIAVTVHNSQNATILGKVCFFAILARHHVFGYTIGLTVLELSRIPDYDISYCLPFR
ncbi:hypothetical protein D3C75_1210780 [compost metagenome]